MKKLMLYAIVFMVSRAIASDQWFCTEASSRVLNSEIQSCGYSYRPNEAEAREDAFVFAQQEFQRICDSSYPNTCASRGFKAIPERTECKPRTSFSRTQNKLISGVECYRMVRFVFNK